MDIKTENRFPDCVHMDLVVNPLDTDEGRKIQLFLTINFNLESVDTETKFGIIEFGLRRGELRIKLDNGKVPYEFRELTGTLEPSIKKEREVQEHAKLQKDMNASKPRLSQEKTSSKKDSYQILSCQITTKGSENNPAWVFETVTGEPILKGLLSKRLLGIVNKIESKPSIIEATFSVPFPKDLHITHATNSLTRFLSQNKLKIIRAQFAKWFFETQLEPYLCRQKIQYDS